MIRNLSVILLVTFMVAACAPPQFEPWTPPEIVFEPTEPYEIQAALDSIPKPEKLKPLYVSMQGDTVTQVPRDQATHILLVPREYAKVGAVVKLAKTYKKIVIEQEAIINSYIEANNALKELLALERQKVLMYREMWVDSENAYRQEKYLHDRDNLINRTGMTLITIGAIIAIALAL